MASFRQAINDKCKDCVYDPAGKGNWREQVFMCAATQCPLWPLRPKPAGFGYSMALLKADPDHPWWQTEEPSKMTE